MRWIIFQRWEDLLFLHWRESPASLRAMLPRCLEPDVHGDEGWIAVTPFRIRGTRLKGFPPLPGLSMFPEVNVRTYVTHRGRPGVYFFSLDIGNRLAAVAARSLYRLPYFFAERMTCRNAGETVEYQSRRAGGGAEFAASYRPLEPPFRARLGSLEDWLTARYSLFAVKRHSLFRADIAHEPWPLQRAEAEIGINTLARASGLSVEREPDFLHFARTLDVHIGPPRRIA